MLLYSRRAPASFFRRLAAILVLLLASFGGAAFAAPTFLASSGDVALAAPASAAPATAPQAPNAYAGLWVGEMKSAGVVANAPGGKTIKTWWAGRRVLLYAMALDKAGTAWYRVSQAPEAAQYVRASQVRQVMQVKYEGALFPGRWVNVNITQQVVTAYQDGVPVMVTLGSTGTAKHPTNLGVQKILWRLPSTEMKGGSKATGDYYDLKNVPWTQYFNNTGEGLHGTYWHDNFGRPMSHGCVNLSTPMAKWFYDWANYGTVVYVHY